MPEITWIVKIRRSDLLYYVFVFLFRIFIDWTYSAVIAPKYEYMGFHSNPDVMSFLISWVILLVLAFCASEVYQDSQSLSAKVMLLLLLFSVVPFTTLVAFRNCTMFFTLWNTIYLLVLFGSYWLLKHACHREIQIKKGPIKLKMGSLVDYMTILFVLVIVYVSGRYTHFRFNFSLNNVYDLRAEAADFDMPTLLNYLFSWSRALIPICLGIYIRKKRIGMVCACIFAQLLSFGIDGSKSPLFLAGCVVLINMMPRGFIDKLNTYILAGMCAAVMLPFLLFVCTGNFYLCSLITRRVFLLPAYIETCYFDYFLDKAPDFFRGSFMRFFGFQTAYPDLARTIGALYFRAPDANFNNGLLSDTIANLGYCGTLIMPCLISCVLLLLDKCAKGLDPRIHLAASLSIALNLQNTTLFTSLLSHGILLLMVLLANVDRDEKISPLLE